MDTLKIKKASHNGMNEIADFQIVSDGIISDQCDAADWLTRDLANGREEGRRLAEFLVKHLPGRSVDGLLLSLLERQATALRVHHEWTEELVRRSVQSK